MSKEVKIIYKLKDLASKGLNKVAQSFDKNKVKARKLQERLEGLGKAGRFLAGISGVIATGLGFMAIKSLKASGALEQQKVALEVLTGSAQKASELLNKINKVAIKTPFEQKQIIDSTTALLSFGVANEKVIPTFKVIGDIAQGNGEKLERLTRAYGKVQAKGKSSMEEIQMVAEAGVPIIQALADTMGVTKEEVFNLSSQGKISADIFNKAMKSMTAEGGIFYQSMIKQSATAEGKASTFRGNLDLIAQTIGKVLLPIWKNTLDILNKLAEGFLNMNPQIRKAVVVFGGIATVTAVLLTGLGGMMALLPILAGGFQMLGISMNAAFFGIPAIIGVVVTAIAAFGIAYKKNFLGIGKATDLALSSLIAGVKSALIILTTNMKLFATLVMGILTKPFSWSTYKTVVVTLVDRIKDMFGIIGGFLKAVVNKMLAITTKAKEAAEKAKNAALDKLKEFNNKAEKEEISLSDKIKKIKEDEKTKLLAIKEDLEKKKIDIANKYSAKKSEKKDSGKDKVTEAEDTENKIAQVKKDAVKNLLESERQSLLDTENEHIASYQNVLAANSNLTAEQFKLQQKQTKAVRAGVAARLQAEVSTAKSVDDVGKGLARSLMNTIKETLVNILFGKQFEAMAHIGIEIAKHLASMDFVGAGIAASQLAVPAAQTAVGVAAINSAMTPRFENSGIVPGKSYTGDKVPILANSGELILDRAKQTNIAYQLQQLQAIQKLGQNQGNHHSSEPRYIVNKISIDGREIFEIFTEYQEENESTKGY